jgi:hypothetical protein
MAPKAAQEKAKKKAKKQRKVLMILAVPMLGALVYAYVTLSSLGGGSKPEVVGKAQVSATPTAATVPAASIPTADTTDATATAGIDVPSVVSLHSFITLGRKDPFHDHGPNPNAAKSSGTTKTSKSTSKGSDTTGTQTKTPPAPLTGAVISMNGKKLALPLGAKFGQAPGLSGIWLFRLVKVTKTTALIDVVGTQQQFTLHVRQPLTLQQSGGWTYTLTLEPPGTATPMTVQPTQPAINDAGGTS